MANVNLPTPVWVAGGVLCLLAGYLVGAVAGPDSPDRATASVASYDARTTRLCLSGDAAEEADGSDDGQLCGTWQRSEGATTPREGDTFRFVTVTTAKAPSGTGSDDDQRVLIFGDVVD